MMPLEFIPDWEMRLKRQDAFWYREIWDRPVVHITFPKKKSIYPHPKKSFSDLKDAWFDAEFCAEKALAHVMNTEYMGDSLPHAFPNLGPEVFSAFFGCELTFSEDTSWSNHPLTNWEKKEELVFSESNFYWKKIIELTEAFLHYGKHRFYTGITDLHPGADAIVGFRGAMNLNLDMLEHSDAVASMLDKVTQVFFQVFDFYYARLQQADQPISTWAGIVSDKKWYVPSNDFSCMISENMFNAYFLPGIVQEIEFLETSMYHLDGEGALRHLDKILEIERLNAMQWVYGAGKGRASDWIWVYKKCQEAGKSIQLWIELDELPVIMEYLRPEGVWLGISDVTDQETAESVLKKVGTWK